MGKVVRLLFSQGGLGERTRNIEQEAIRKVKPLLEVFFLPHLGAKDEVNVNFGGNVMRIEVILILKLLTHQFFARFLTPG